ncbi:MAG TPA: hypothetical protein VJV03_15020 [Pyrinomonadaceae bacterium]|nr:hypothetical protein [Pyrinomonadaceae bacterium]
MVNGQLEESLRHEIESYIEGRIGGIKQEIAALQSQLNESLTRMLDRQSEVQLDGGVAASIQEHLRAAHEGGIDLAAAESSRAQASSDMAIIKAAIDEIDEQQTQSDILQVLVNRAAAFAPRVAFFVVKGDQGIGWRARGFQGTVGDNAIHQMSFPLSADTAVGSAARSRETWSGAPNSHSEDHIIVNRLGDEAPAHLVALPLVVRQRAVAILYADSDRLDAEAINLEALETLVRVSAMAVELLASRSGAVPAPSRTVEEPEREEQPTPETAPSYTPTVEYDEITPVVEGSTPEPVAVEAEPVRVEPTPAPAPSFVEPQDETAPLSAEAPPPVETPPAPPEVIRAEVSPAPEPPAAPRRRYGMDVELPVDVSSEEERRLHNDARRFARLLVSEIKLYNENKVTEGRAQYDLYDRLREYIDRSREMYDKRVKPEVAQRYDYFHHELVNTLAEGDAGKLGNAYPGATVSA